jgi:hypothetical protein
MAIARSVEEGLMLERDVTALGWTKARAIASLLHSKADIRRAVQFGLEHSITELLAYLRTGSVEKRVVRQFYLTEAEAAQLDGALLANGARRARRGLVKREAALMKIVRGVAPIRATPRVAKP